MPSTARYQQAVTGTSAPGSSNNDVCSNKGISDLEHVLPVCTLPKCFPDLRIAFPSAFLGLCSQSIVAHDLDTTGDLSYCLNL
jgi:hypothetical protein